MFNSLPTSIITDLLYTHSPKQRADAHPAEACSVIKETIQELNELTTVHAFKFHANIQVKEREEDVGNEKFPGLSVMWEVVICGCCSANLSSSALLDENMCSGLSAILVFQDLHILNNAAALK